MTQVDDQGWFLDQAGVFELTAGGNVAIRVELVDRTPEKPHGLDYALVLNDASGSRILGFDNKHRYNGGAAGQPFDHEHKYGRPGIAFRYDFTSVYALYDDFGAE